MMGRMCDSRVILAFMLVLASQAKSCFIHTEERSPTCIGHIYCSTDVGGYLEELLSTWSCRDYISYEKDIYGRGIGFEKIRDDYWFKLSITNASNYLDVVTNDHITELSVTNGKLELLQPILSGISSNIQVLDFSRNVIATINLETLANFDMLKSFNVSYNSVVTLEGELVSKKQSQLMLDIIDLSHNLIEEIPNNYFVALSNLRTLNISNNLIKNINILSFEGLSKLNTLHLSNNLLTHLGLNLARFVNLQSLYLDHNYIESIQENNFRSMLKLLKLNISSNDINLIADKSFYNLESVEDIDLSNNKLKVISKTMFVNNYKLRSLDVSNNHICKIEFDSFKNINVTNIKLMGNTLSGILDKRMLLGIYVEELDLSVGNIVALGSELFFKLEPKLKYFNLSHNSINSIDKQSFKSMEALVSLDLSYNKLETIEFDTKTLKNLSNISIKNNFLKRITVFMFKNLSQLKTIDLSYNDIQDIEAKSFEELYNLEFIFLNDNPFSNIIMPYTFRGLYSTIKLDMMYTKLSTYQDNAFEGMISLQLFNASYGDLTSLAFNVFNETGAIEVLDLSHNLLNTFTVNNSHLKCVKELYLNDNKLKEITNVTFLDLTQLSKVNLENNYVVQIDHDAFVTDEKLSHLILSFNSDLLLNTRVFTNLSSLKVVSLSNVQKPFKFDNSIKYFIANLELSWCNIANINDVQVSTILSLEILNLQSNMLRFVDKSSFSNLSSLNMLDLSNNIISSISPGTFFDTPNLEIINLHNNRLKVLQFGAFDGIHNLLRLNLSNNILHSFKPIIFHNVHHVREISLEDNVIEHLNFDEIRSANIQELAIGGNKLICEDLVNWKRLYLHSQKMFNIHYVFVKAEKPNYHTENVDGISCYSNSSDTKEHNISINAELNNSTKTDLIRNQDFNSLNGKLNYDDLKTALYFVGGCLVVTIMCMVLIFIISGFIYFKFIKRSLLQQNFDVGSRQHISSAMEIEL